ncbi:MAG: RNA-binding S4 domain-containing protein [Bacilli bacterium]|nr:RNA-binding S4 domain-containing protein [Bacilli bacterium]
MMVVKISTGFIKLNQFLKLAGIIVNGGEAKELIQDGLVFVNDVQEFARGKKLFPGDKVKFDGIEYIVESE